MSQHTPVPQSFVDYMKKNYPEGTVISDAAWHARPIWNAACHALQNDPLTRAATDLMAVADMVLATATCHTDQALVAAATEAIRKARGE